MNNNNTVSQATNLSSNNNQSSELGSMSGEIGNFVCKFVEKVLRLGGETFDLEIFKPKSDIPSRAGNFYVS